MSDSLRPHGLYSPWNSTGQNTGVDSLSFLQGIFPTQGSNPDLLYHRWILNQLSHKGSPRILEWVAYPFSKGSSQPRNWTRVSCIAGRVCINWAMREAYFRNNWWIMINLFCLLNHWLNVHSFIAQVFWCSHLSSESGIWAYFCRDHRSLKW